MTRSRPSKDPSRPLQLQRHPETPERANQDLFTMPEPELVVLPPNQAWVSDEHYETPAFDFVTPVFDFVTPGKNPHAVELGRLGGLKGGRARAEALSPEQRRKIARKAAQARWKNSNR
jgi:hypothetical protein